MATECAEFLFGAWMNAEPLRAVVAILWASQEGQERRKSGQSEIDTRAITGSRAIVGTAYASSASYALAGGVKI
jgi:hypothetical protein